MRRIATISLALLSLGCGNATGTEALDVVARGKAGQTTELRLTRLGDQATSPFVTLSLSCGDGENRRFEIVSETFTFDPDGVRYRRLTRELRWQGNGPVTITEHETHKVGTYVGRFDKDGRYVLVGLRSPDAFDWESVELRDRGTALAWLIVTGGSCLGDSQPFRGQEKLFTGN